MKRLGILLVRAYQVTIGPLFSGACRFEPSCSNYAIGALERFGLVRGSWLTARRSSGAPRAPVPATTAADAPARVFSLRARARVRYTP